MRILFLLTVMISSLFSIGIPSQYAAISTPLFEARAAFYRLPADDYAVREKVLQYAVMCNQVQEFGYKSSPMHDRQLQKAYLKKLHQLQSHYEKLSVFMLRELNRAIDTDNYPQFLSIVNTKMDTFFEDPNLKERIYAYYCANRFFKSSQYLDKRINDERQTIIHYNTARENRYAYSSTPNARFREVRILTTSFCPYCTRTKNFLRQNGIRFSEYDIHGSEKGKALYEKLGGRGVPVLIINNTVIHGYNESKMQKALKE
ncbi:glutaredoxin domain-containing protein [Sulfurimonas sp. HSL3-7]|uniref:glutaredoxin family protein n=1 Tax=Sulfonitrofixus jiaomeiensis TaxID=3131938 RepID=UPI0031F94F4B